MLAAVMGTVLAMSSFQTAYATKQDVEAAKKKVSSIEEEKKKVQATIKNLEGLKNDAAAYVKELDGSLTKLEGELDQLSTQIGNKEQEIADTGVALEQAKETENKQYADMKLRIKYMYEQGNTSYIDMLFQSEDMVQLMNRAEYINKISDYDRKKMDEYEATRQTIADEEQKLKDDREALLDMQEKTKAKQESVKTLRAQKNKEMQSYAGQIDTAQSQVDQYNADLAAQENKIKQIEAEIKRKEEEERKKAEAARKAEEEARKKAEAAGKKVSATDKAASHNVASLVSVQRTHFFRFRNQNLSDKRSVQQPSGNRYPGIYRSGHHGSSIRHGCDIYLQLFCGKLHHDQSWRRCIHRIYALFPDPGIGRPDGKTGTDHCESRIYRLFHRFAPAFWNPFRRALCKSAVLCKSVKKWYFAVYSYKVPVRTIGAAYGQQAGIINRRGDIIGERK